MKADALTEFDTYRKERLSVETLQKKLAELEKAKNNVRWLLDNPNGSADFHGLGYWGAKVENLVKEIKENL